MPLRTDPLAYSRGGEGQTTARVTGGAQLSGSVTVGGAKNAAAKLLLAATLARGTTTVHNVPNVLDTRVTCELLESAGCTVDRGGDGTVSVDTTGFAAIVDDLVHQASGRSRVPVLSLAPSLAAGGTVRVAPAEQVGGCRIGERPIGMHIAALQALGARQVGDGDELVLTLDGGRFRGATFTLDYPSVGATEQFLLAAVRAEGRSELHNAAIEPEIMNLVHLLQRMGASITKLPHRVFRIIGVEQLRPAAIRVIPDRLEAASWACLALATDGRITVRDVVQDHLSAFLDVFQQAGGMFEFSPDDGHVTFWRGRWPASLHIETDVHPGFMTDWQPALVSARTQAPGVTVLHETVYEDRLGYLAILDTMGATVATMAQCLGSRTCRFVGRDDQHSAVIVGPQQLQGKHLEVPDLRGGFAYLIAALVADGESRIDRFDILDRGYMGLLEKLRCVGATIEVSPTPPRRRSEPYS